MLRMFSVGYVFTRRPPVCLGKVVAHLRGARGTGSERVNTLGRMLDQKLRGLWDRTVRPVGKALGRTGLSANAVTTAGLLIQVGAAALILDGRLVAAGLVAIVA